MENYDPPRFTLGDLYRELESSEFAYDANMRDSDRLRQERSGSLKALSKQIQARCLRWQPDPGRMPGIDRIEVICNRRFGTRITAKAVLLLRAEICNLTSMELKEANNLVLTEAADVLKDPAAAKTTQKTRGPKPDPAKDDIERLREKGTVGTADIVEILDLKKWNGKSPEKRVRNVINAMQQRESQRKRRV